MTTNELALPADMRGEACLWAGTGRKSDQQKVKVHVGVGEPEARAELIKRDVGIVVDDPQSTSLAFATTSVLPTDLAKSAGAGHHVAHFRVFRQRMLQFPVALVGQIVAEEAGE